MNEKLKAHLISASITFGTSFLVDIAFLTRDAQYLGDVAWAAIASAATLTAGRAVIKELVGLKVKS